MAAAGGGGRFRQLAAWYAGRELAEKPAGIDGSRTVKLEGDDRAEAGEKKLDPHRQTWRRTPNLSDVRNEQPTAFEYAAEDLLPLSAKDFSHVSLIDESPASSASFPLMAPLEALPRLPKHAPDWMRMARSLSTWLEQLIARGEIDEWEQVGVERAATAWKLAGISRRRMRSLATLLQRAHAAIRSPALGSAQTAVHDCAEVVYRSLPRDVKVHTSMEVISEVVHGLRAEADPWIAVVHGTSRVLGWTEYARAHAARALRCAIEAGEEKKS